MGILICGLNGAGKSTVGRLLAGRIGYEFIDNEELWFPGTDPSYAYAGPRTKEEVIRLLEERIAGNRRFVFAAVRGDYGDRLAGALELIVLIEAPKQVRSRRVRERSFLKFGDRMLAGGDLFERESRWFALTDRRPEDDVTNWLQTAACPVIRIDGTLPPEQNAAYVASVLAGSPEKPGGS